METLEFIKTAKDGKIIIDVPEALEGKEVKVLVIEENEDIKKFHLMPVAERIKILEQYKGSAKYPDAETNKYDVYDQ
jgi:hypothetical protein